jgi:fatty-acyl-CoA synthase
LGRVAEHRRRTAALATAAGASLALAAEGVCRLLGEGAGAAKCGVRWSTISQLPSAGGAAPAASPRPQDLALVQLSSGSTSDPKPVALSHHALITQARLLNSLWPDAPQLEQRGVSWLPLFHDMGLVGALFTALERAGELTLLSPELFVARPAVWLRAISRHRATVSAAPDFGYAHCVSRIRDEELAGVDLSCWHHALDGAETISPRTLRAFARRFARWGFDARALTPVYGLAEAGLAVTSAAQREPFTSRRFDRRRLVEEGVAEPGARGRELVSVGRPVAGFEVAIRDRAGRDLPAGRLGRVWVRGPSLMNGYLGRPEVTAATLRKGWLDTGDLGFLHRGELFLTGRAREIVVLRGRNHAPEEIEEPVAALPSVRAAAAASHLPEGGQGERLVLLVEATAPPPPGLPTLCGQAVLAAVGVAPDEVVVLPAGALPRTSSGKLRRREALRRHLAGSLAAVAPPGETREAGGKRRGPPGKAPAAAAEAP